jgi:hypothetical protein
MEHLGWHSENEKGPFCSYSEKSHDIQIAVQITSSEKSHDIQIAVQITSSEKSHDKLTEHRLQVFN